MQQLVAEGAKVEGSRERRAAEREAERAAAPCGEVARNAGPAAAQQHREELAAQICGIFELRH